MSSSSPLLGAASFNSMSSRAKSFLNDGSHGSPPAKGTTTSKSSNKKKRGGGLRRPLSFLSSPFQGHAKATPHVKLSNHDEGDAVDQIKHDIASLQSQVRNLNESYNAARTLRFNDDHNSSYSSDGDDDELPADDNHSQQLQELNRKLLHIQAGLMAIESERCHLLSKGKQIEKRMETMEDQLATKDTQIQLLQDENLQLRQQSLRQQESGPFEVQQMKKKYETMAGNFVKVCEKLAKSSKRVANMEFEKKALISLNQALQAKIQRVEHRNRQEVENMQEILKHNANQLADLEDLLKEKSKLIDKLGDQLSTKDSNAAASIQSSTAYFDRKLHLARKQHEADIQAQKHSHSQQVNSLQRQLQEKTSEYEALRAEFDSQMQRLMSATAEIDRFSDERATIQTLVARLEALDRECADYKEILFAKDTKIAVLRADNMKKDLEMRYSTPHQQETTGESSPRQGSPLPVPHVITPQRPFPVGSTGAFYHEFAASNSPTINVGDVLAENTLLKERLRRSICDTKKVSDEHTASGATCVSTLIGLDDSCDWGIEESRISNATSRS